METIAAAPGWYPCPVAAGQVRYFDGRGWTDAVLPAPRAAMPSPEPGVAPSDPLHWVMPTGRSGVSIAAGYLGIFALFIWVLGPVAIGMGVWGLVKARAGGHGSGRSIFGIVAGLLAIVLGVLALTGNLWDPVL